MGICCTILFREEDVYDSCGSVIRVSASLLVPSVSTRPISCCSQVSRGKPGEKFHTVGNKTIFGSKGLVQLSNQVKTTYESQPRCVVVGPQMKVVISVEDTM